MCHHIMRLLYKGEEKKIVYDVVGIGASALDNLSVVDGYPAEDERIEVSEFTWQGGGNVATALVAVARLGGKTCYHGFIGDDENTATVLDGGTGIPAAPLRK